MSERNRKWVHPNAILYQAEGGDRPMHYFRHWEHFTLTFEDFHFVRTFSSLKSDMDLEDREFETVANEMSEQGFAALDKDEQDRFRWHHLSYVKPVEQPESIALHGWARFEGGIGRESVTAFTVADDPAWRRNKGEAYERNFKRVKVAVLSHKEDQHGLMFIQGPEMRNISTDADDPDEDFLYAQFHMALPKLKLLANEVSKLPRKPVLLMQAQGLLFRDEVEAALSEPWHPREYVMIYDHSTPVILNSLSFRMLNSPTPTTHEESSDGAVAKQVKGLKHALWMLATAVILAALVN